MKREIAVGNLRLGGTQPVRIQSMTNTPTDDVEKTVSQILALEKLGCEMVRVSVNHQAAALALPAIKERIHIPLIADIHFNQSLALAAMDQGADKIRINPGNMPQRMLDAIIEKAGERQIPIRIGVNSGSVEKEILERYGLSAESMLVSLENYVRYFERRGFRDLVLSAKASSVPLTVAVNELLHEHLDYPLHLGVTEAGLDMEGIVKSSVGIGSLLLKGIGSTLRVSLTGSPLKEIPVAKSILESVGLRRGLNIISCPTCARTSVDLEALVRSLKERLGDRVLDLDIAVMGCAVNGPGEAREADIGIAGGKDHALLFKKGEIVGKYSYHEILDRLIEEIETLGG